MREALVNNIADFDTLGIVCLVLVIIMIIMAILSYLGFIDLNK